MLKMQVSGNSVGQGNFRHPTEELPFVFFVFIGPFSRPEPVLL
jgi:hypothetical protein